MGSVRLQNIYVRTKDMGASREFYEGMLGVSPSSADGDHWIQYKLGNANFALAGARERTEADIVAVFEVDSLADIGSEAARLGGTVMDRRDMGGHGEVLTVADPAGVIVQFFMRHAEKADGR